MAVVPAMENVALWHERDISHSSVERMIGPDATVTLDFALHRLAGVIEKLVIYPENMLRQHEPLPRPGHSQRVLLALTQAGVSREDAYRLVQRNAMKVWEQGADFQTELLADPEVRAALSPAEIEEKFDLGYHTKHVDTIFARVFGRRRHALRGGPRVRPCRALPTTRWARSRRWSRPAHGPGADLHGLHPAQVRRARGGHGLLPRRARGESRQPPRARPTTGRGCVAGRSGRGRGAAGEIRARGGAGGWPEVALAGRDPLRRGERVLTALAGPLTRRCEDGKASRDRAL
jgi:hypothetical protein